MIPLFGTVTQVPFVGTVTVLLMFHVFVVYGVVSTAVSCGLRSTGEPPLYLSWTVIVLLTVVVGDVNEKSTLPVSAVPVGVEYVEESHVAVALLCAVRLYVGF